MRTLLARVKTYLSATTTTDVPYECAACGRRFARQPHSCPECRSYQVDWVGWRDDHANLDD